ncbi:unnamed protein product [Pleuronectes platessa]|uniref:Uncharacterized protein n=1 Tax=Pleuronectes platessa TaxID=8262 RepID=A0A9N7VCM6_PLEPL|nr:unnamed protein product [Pleuronectes platessa]
MLEGAGPLSSIWMKLGPRQIHSLAPAPRCLYVAAGGDSRTRRTRTPRPEPDDSLLTEIMLISVTHVGSRV